MARKKKTAEISQEELHGNPELTEETFCMPKPEYVDTENNDPYNVDLKISKR